MRKRLKDILKGPVVFYPLLFAAFPILFLYAHNMSETSMGQAWLPLGVSVAAALVLWAVLSLILRSLAKAGLTTAIFLLFFFFYGRLYEALEAWGVFVPKDAYLLAAMLFIWGYCVYFISRAKRDFRITTKVLNIVAVALIAVNLFNIGSYQLKLARLSSMTTEQTPEEATNSSAELSTLPDIYLIILDEYAHLDTMKEWYDYDNSEFVNSLEDKGFFVASGSKARTPNTTELIAQVLNMEYLTQAYYWDEATKQYRGNTSGQVKDFSDEERAQLLYRKIGYSKVADFLTALGYQYIFFGNWLSSTRWDNYMKDNADLYFNYYLAADTPWVSEFQDILWSTTMLRPFYRHILGSQYEVAYRREKLSTLEHLKVMPEVEGPKFVFAHLMCPHAPFVFGPSGEYIFPQNYQNYEDKNFYRGQYIFISAETKKLVNALLEESETSPVIILQSDHGLRPHHTGITIGGDEWQKILNAMYLPGMDYSELSDSISPVNTFRLIFKHYFGGDYPLLEDD
jgi:hypothetical protein